MGKILENLNLTLLIGIFIIYKAVHRKHSFVDEPPNNVAPLGLMGGFVDAIGGGGWGPIVTSTLLGQGTQPRYTIGSVNMAEFFVTLTISATFIATIGLSLWPTILGLVIGGGYEVRRTLHRDLKLLDFTEVTRQRSARLASCGDHHCHKS